MLPPIPYPRAQPDCTCTCSYYLQWSKNVVKSPQKKKTSIICLLKVHSLFFYGFILLFSIREWRLGVIIVQGTVSIKLSVIVLSL